MAKLSRDYDIEEFQVEELVTDSGKELKLRGNELKRKNSNEMKCFLDKEDICLK